MPNAMKARGSRSEHGAHGWMDFHECSSERDGKGARGEAATGLCCRQKGDLVGKKNEGRLTEKSREHLMKRRLAS